MIRLKGAGIPKVASPHLLAPGDAMRALDAVQATDGVPIATPANWVPGQDVIVALSLNDQQATEKFGKLDIKLPYLRFAKAPGK